MAKKRKTRQQKIIAQLRRQLESSASQTPALNTFPEPRQGAISIEPEISLNKSVSPIKQADTIFSYNPRLIRKDIFKTLILTLIVISFEVVLYLKLR